jgi:hypothetical protein
MIADHARTLHGAAATDDDQMGHFMFANCGGNPFELLLPGALVCQFRMAA